MAYATRTNPFAIERRTSAGWVSAASGGAGVRSGIDDEQAVAWFRAFCRHRRAPHRLIQYSGLGAGTLHVLATHGDVGQVPKQQAICPVALAIRGTSVVGVPSTGNGRH